MGVNAILNIAKNALFAQQTALQITSNNIANVTTPGYARQEAILTEQTAILTDVGLLGNGVQVLSVMSHYNKYLDSSLAKETTAYEEQKTYEQYFSRIESILDENNTNLTSNITAFFNAWQSLSAEPTSLTAQLNVATCGANLTNGIRSMCSELRAMQTEVDDKVSQEVTDINDILESIARLNDQIIALNANGVQDSSFGSQRAQLVQKLSAKMDIQTFEDGQGGLTVMTSGGKTLVDRGTVFGLTATRSSEDNFYRITWSGNNASSVDITNTILGGSVKALIDLRDNQLAGFMDAIDDLARSLMTEINIIHAAGYTANGTTGITFFKTATQNYGMTFDISDEIKADAENIAATSSASNPTDNDIALAISRLGSTSLTIGRRSTTYADYGASIASKIGSLSQNAKNLTQYHQDLVTSIQAQRDSISGVSIDEEMANLIKFQYAYQAAARLIGVADALMQSLLEIGR